MAFRRKVFTKTDLTIPVVEHEIERGRAVIPLEVIPPPKTLVNFKPQIFSKQTFDFAPWYGVGIDQVTYACQRQVERFLARQDAEVNPITVASYCHQGLRNFLNYMVIRSAALCQELKLNDIDREVIDGYIASFEGENVSTLTKRGRYQSTKAVLKSLCQRGLIPEVHGGDSATFPGNPFPGADSTAKGEHPLSLLERRAFSAAVKDAVLPLFDDAVSPTSNLLAYALLVIALHTGRNTTPLLEMTSDCMRRHPKDDTWFLVLYKRRGHSTSKIAVRQSRGDAKELEAMPTLRPTVGKLIHRVLELAAPLQREATAELRERVWLYRMRSPGRGRGKVDEVAALTESTLALATRLLVQRYNLKDSDGKPLRINVSRLRKTFVNRIYEILDGDVAATAAAAGNTVKVTSFNYLRPGEDAEKNWRFLGQTLSQELLSSTLGATERTPVGKCSDTRGGEYAPKSRALVCMSFLNCVRCRNYVVTADDLYRLFSFYWRILSERSHMDKRRWNKQLAHVARLIDRDVVTVGLANGAFNKETVDRERERARWNPHPFWRSESAIADLYDSES